jgi:hypothetical protein
VLAAETLQRCVVHCVKCGAQAAALQVWCQLQQLAQLLSLLLLLLVLLVTWKLQLLLKALLLCCRQHWSAAGTY